MIASCRWGRVSLRLNLACLSVPRDAIWKIAYDYQSSEENHDHRIIDEF
jgi:hypothetical protein